MKIKLSDLPKGTTFGPTAKLPGESDPMPHTPEPGLGIMAIEVEMPIRVVSEANQRCHWAARHKRFKAQRSALYRYFATLGVVPMGRLPSPATVVLTKVGGKAMDGDNLAGAFKGIRDALAGDWLAVDDGSDLVSWVYCQRPGKGPHGIRVRIEAKEAEDA